MKILDLFCGAGGSASGLQHPTVSEIVGIDCEPQPHYPFTFYRADVLELSPHFLQSFDFIWASPPCQAYSKTHRIRAVNHPRLLDLVRSRLRAKGVGRRDRAIPYCIENVEDANCELRSPVRLCGAMFGLRVYRHRLFETSFPCTQPPHPKHWIPQCKMGRSPLEGEFLHVVGNFAAVNYGRRAMGVEHWMTGKELREAIPPAYSRYILLEYLKGEGIVSANVNCERRVEGNPN